MTAWADYALDARLMLRQRDGGGTSRVGTFAPGSTTTRTPPTPPTSTVHMSTLFPPVRPRGWFEVRYLDAQPWQWWPVPMAVLTALVDDAGAAAAAIEACAGLDDWEAAAARDGLAAPGCRTPPWPASAPPWPRCHPTASTRTSSR